MPAILFVDDEAMLRRTAQRWLEGRGVAVHTASSILGAKQSLARHAVEGAFIDVWLADGSGFELYAWVQAHYPRLADRVTFMTGEIGDAPRADRHVKTLGRPVIIKPYSLAELEWHVGQWLGTSRQRAAGRPRTPPPP